MSQAGTDPAGGQRSHLIDRRDGIDGRRRVLTRRLDDGYRRIDDALHDGADIEAWEDFWLGLLREYEAVCDEIKIAA